MKMTCYNKNEKSKKRRKQTAIMTTGEKVKQARIAKGLAQDYIAARLGISKSAVSRCELGQRQFRVDQLYTLANLLDVPPYELVNISPEKKEELKQISKIISNFEDRYYHGDYIGEADQWIPQSMEFLKQLIERELATAAAEPGPDGASSENSQEPELKKRRRRTAKFDAPFPVSIQVAPPVYLIEAGSVISILIRLLFPLPLRPLPQCHPFMFQGSSWYTTASFPTTA